MKSPQVKNALANRKINRGLVMEHGTGDILKYCGDCSFFFTFFLRLEIVGHCSFSEISLETYFRKAESFIAAGDKTFRSVAAARYAAFV
jgi:hypothetical protein